MGRSKEYKGTVIKDKMVYQVGIEDGEPVVAKFYRPGRWSDEAIQEEHDFALELAAAEIPVIAPIVFRDAPADGPAAGKMSPM